MPLFFAVGSSGSVGPTNGGKVWAFNNLPVTSTQVLGANPARATLIFHNPGANTIYVNPTADANGAPLAPTLSNLGGAFMLVSGGQLILSGEIQLPWAAFGSTTGCPLTIMESNIA